MALYAKGIVRHAVRFFNRIVRNKALRPGVQVVTQKCPSVRADDDFAHMRAHVLVKQLLAHAQIGWRVFFAYQFGGHGITSP